VQPREVGRVDAGLEADVVAEPPRLLMRVSVAIDIVEQSM
jgi:hypothetical protein